MSVRRGRSPRPDDWPSAHARARGDLAERLDGPIDAAEAAWLNEHLAGCDSCTRVASDYEAQRSELRTLRDRAPVPPRDLWARTAAAIEAESRFRDTRRRASRRRASLAPFVVLTTAVAVAVIVGSLTSSQQLGGDDTAAASSPPVLDAGPQTASAAASTPGATPLAVAQRVEWLAQASDGLYRIQVADVDEVCPADATVPCDRPAPVEDRPVSIDQDAASVFGSEDHQTLIVVDSPESGGGTVSVVDVDPSIRPSPSPSPSPTATPTPGSTASQAATASPRPSSTPSATVASATPAGSVVPSGAPSSAPPSATPTVPAPPSSESPSATPSPSVTVTPEPSSGTLEIARDVILVGQSAAYSPDGDRFAFTARAADGRTGPDIYVWRVGDPVASPVTADHRSVFGSWDGRVLVGSRTIAPTTSASSAPDVAVSFRLDPATGTQVDVPGSTRMWRPSVDPSGRMAVYWAGTLRARGRTVTPDAGRLVLGPWQRGEAPSGVPAADESGASRETTIAAGRMDDWDARWDSDGTHLAVWIADQRSPALGRLSLYAVNPFDGRLDLKSPLLDATLAVAGFSIGDGKLVWAEPGRDGATTGGRIQVLAWTDEGSGQVETVPGPVIVIR